MFAPLRNKNNFNAINQIHEFLAANVQKKTSAIPKFYGRSKDFS